MNQTQTFGPSLAAYLRPLPLGSERLVPFTGEGLTLAVDNLGAETLDPIRMIVEAEGWVFRERDSCLDGQQLPIALPNHHRPDEMRRNIVTGELIHLHPGVVRVPDHKLCLGCARMIGCFRGLAEAHRADRDVAGHLLERRRRTAASRLDEALGDVKRAVARLGNRVQICIGVDPHSGRDAVDAAVGPELEDGGEGRRVLVNDERDLADSARIGWRQKHADGERHHRGILGTVGRVDRQHRISVPQWAVMEDLAGERRPGIRRCRRLPACPATAEAKRHGEGRHQCHCSNEAARLVLHGCILREPVPAIMPPASVVPGVLHDTDVRAGEPAVAAVVPAAGQAATGLHTLPVTCYRLAGARRELEQEDRSWPGNARKSARSASAWKSTGIFPPISDRRRRVTAAVRPG